MLSTIPIDCLEIILKYSTIDTYYNCLLVNKITNNNLKLLKLYYFYAKSKLSILHNKNSIQFCTNADCPNKLHLGNSAVTILKEKDLDVELMIEYKNILSVLRKGNKNGNRIDKTITSEYPNLRKILKITQIPYCEDCLLDYNDSLYTYIESEGLFN